LPDFEVVAMALAPARHLAAFTDHYRAKHPARIRIYFDGEDAPDPVQVGLDPKDLIVCDAAFWATRGGRPQAVEDRQRVVYAEAYSTLASDWLLVVDIDEMILGDVDVSAVLGAVAAEREAVIFPSRKLVQTRAY